MNRFLIVDGSSMLASHYYASAPTKGYETEEEYNSKIRKTSDGIYTNAIYGMLRAIFRLLDQQKPTHFAVVFDKGRDTFRRKIYPEYKQTRKESPDPLKKQSIMMTKLLPWIGIPVLSSEEYEADDYAASLVKKFESADTSMYLLTKDKDYLQLASDHTDVWIVQQNQKKTEELYEKYYYSLGFSPEYTNLPHKVFSFTPELVKQEYGIYPEQVPDFKGLSGDTSDNIPGVYRISEKVAATLLAEFGTVESLYQMLEKVDASNKEEVEKIDNYFLSIGLSRSPFRALTKEHEGRVSGKAAAMMSKVLATMKSDIPISESLYHFCVNINWDRVKQTYRRLELGKI